MSSDDLTKLKKLLEFWIDHNNEHGDEFKEWAEKANQMGKDSVYRDLTAAAKDITEANKSLARALDKLRNE